MSISPIYNSPPSSYNATPATTNVASSVPASADAGLAQQASALSTTSGIVATLGSASGTTAQVYDAAGLYNSIAQAGTSTNTSAATNGGATSGAAAGTSGNTAVSSQQSLDSAILSSLPSATVNSGFYNGTGVLQSTSTSNANLTANWASALQSNPNLSRIVAADSYAQGIIGTLSVTA